MKKCLMLSVVVLFALSAGNLSAATVACPINTTFDQLLLYNTAANGCYSQDKIFFGFNYTPTGIAGAVTGVQAGLILETGATDIHGWNFSDTTWAQSGSSLAGFTIGYSIEMCPSASVCGGVPPTPGERIFGADAVYAPVSTVGSGSEVVTWGNGHVETLTFGSPGPLPSNGDIGLGSAGTQGPISVSAVFDGHGDITQTTFRFYENVATPEPLTILLVGGGLAAVGLLARKRRKV